MKRVNVNGGFVETIQKNIIDTSVKPNSYVVADEFEVFTKWIDNGDGTFTAPVVIVTKADLHAYLAEKRYDVETGGVNAGGIQVMTTRDARGLLRDAAEYLGDTDTRDFKTATGTWVNVTGAQLSAVWGAVEAHVDACFQVEKTAADKIDADTITTYAEIDAEPWPSNS